MIQLQTEWTDALVHPKQCHDEPRTRNCGQSFNQFKTALREIFLRFTEINKPQCLKNTAFDATLKQCQFWLKIANAGDKDMAAKAFLASELPPAKVRYQQIQQSASEIYT